jgi:outer membrane protein
MSMSIRSWSDDMFRIPLTAAVCFSIAASTASAQERLTLSDATARALKSNHAIKIEREDVAASDARILGANGEYDRQLRFDVGFSHGKDPITSIFSGAPSGSVAPTHSSFESGVSLSQLFKTGAVATVSASVARDESNSAFILFDPAYTTSLGVDLRQPLLRNRAIDPARAALRVTALDRDRSSAGLARQVLQTVSQVEVAYWQLVAARRDLEVHRGNVSLAERQREETQVRVKGGTVPGSDLAQPTAEVERRRGELLLAQEGVARAERALKQLMIDSTADPMWEVEIVPVDTPDTPAMSITAAGAIADAQKNRPELAELAAAIAQTEVQTSLATDATKPNLDLVAAYSIRGLAGSQSSWAMPFGGAPSTVPSSLQGGLGSSWGSLGQHDFHDLAVGISFAMPLGNRAARGDLGVAQANRRRAQTELAQMQDRIAVEVRNAMTALETAAGRVQAAQAGLAAAQTQLQAEQERFSAGLTTNFFVLTRQNDLALAQLTEIAARTSYRTAMTELRRATGTLLRERNISIQ